MSQTFSGNRVQWAVAENAGSDHEVLEEAFSCLAHLFKILWRPLRKDLRKAFRLLPLAQSPFLGNALRLQEALPTLRPSPGLHAAVRQRGLCLSAAKGLLSLHLIILIWSLRLNRLCLECERQRAFLVWSLGVVGKKAEDWDGDRKALAVAGLASLWAHAVKGVAGRLHTAAPAVCSLMWWIDLIEVA